MASHQALKLGLTTLTFSDDDKTFYYFALTALRVCAGDGVAAEIPFWPHLLAIRENERRARFLGIDVERHLWLSFVISCAFVSVAGSLYALLNNFTDPRALRLIFQGIL